MKSLQRLQILKRSLQAQVVGKQVKMKFKISLIAGMKLFFCSEAISRLDIVF